MNRRELLAVTLLAPLVKLSPKRRQKWVATLDTDYSDRHAPSWGWHPPLHRNCRSITAPQLKAERQP